MTTGSRKTVTPAGSAPGPDSGAAAPGAGGMSGAPGASDNYVERLGDRISSQHGLPEAQAPGFAAPSFVPMHETSDVHTLPAGGGPDDDEALDLPPLPPAEPADAFAEFEDEMEGETTRIDESHLLAEQSTAIIEDVPVQPFLLVERGPDKGREFVLQEGENGIGRGIDNDVILADVAVSRRHLIVVREGEALRLRDLGSGNGTQVNGKRVSSMVLAEGDRIELGETMMVVRTPAGTQAPLDPDAATDESHIGGSLPPPAAFATPNEPFPVPHGPGYTPELTPASVSTEHVARRTKGAIVLPKPVFFAIILGASLVLAMLGAAVAILVVRSGGSEASEQITIAADPGPFARGLRAYEGRRWDEAERAFREALQQSGSDPRANDLLQRTQRAREHEALVAGARAALAAGDSNTALTQSSSVPADSPLFQQARAVRAQASAQQVAEHLAAARSALAGGDRGEAGRRIALAQNLEPDNAEVAALAAQIGAAAPAPPAPTAPPVAPPAPPPSPPVAAPPVAAPPSPPPAPQASRTEPAPPRGRRERAPRRERERPQAAPAGDVLGAYHGGRFEQAAQAARASAARASGRSRTELEQLATNIDRFGTLYRRAQAARFGPSVRGDMAQAMDLDRRISPRNAQYRDRLRGHVVEALLGDAQRQRSNPVASCGSVRQALAIDGGNVRARQMSTQCEATARGMMREAGTAAPDRATSIYRSVLLMVPPDSTVGREASSRLESLRRRRAVDEDE